MSNFQIIIMLVALYACAWLILRRVTKPLLWADHDTKPDAAIVDCCEQVDVAEIEPPHNTNFTAADLKEQYLEAEAEMTAAHNPAMAQRIRRQMAGCLIQGWPLDVAVCQSAYSFMSGTCRCHTCRSLIESPP